MKGLKMYVFVSFSNVDTKKNLGCCIVRSNEENWLDDCDRLGLRPNGANNIIGYPLNEEEFQAQGIELNRFYTREEMLQEGFEKISPNNETHSVHRFVCVKERTT
jgi:hypothetical protein